MNMIKILNIIGVLAYIPQYNENKYNNILIVKTARSYFVDIQFSNKPLDKIAYTLPYVSCDIQP